MSAQAGGGIVLFYGPQGTAAQSGADVKLWPRSAPPTASAGRVRSAARGAWGAALHRIIPIEAPQAATDEMRVVADAPWIAGEKNEARVGSDWIENNTADAFRLSPWIRAGKRLPYEPLTRWGISTPADDRKHAPWPTKGEHIEAGPFALWALSLRGDDRKLGPWARGSRLVLDFDAIHPTARRGDREQWIPWTRYSRILNPGWGVVVPPGGPEKDENGTIVVPVRRAYIVLNTVTLVRAADGAPLDATALNLQIDADSWTWGWDATIPGAQLALVEPIIDGEPVELLATVNGEQFRLLAERIARERSFGQSRLRISGRSRAAMLASPHSPVVTRSNDIDRTVRQLLDDALTTNGVSLGWAVDWQAADWLVPAGVWSHTGSYIEHAQRIAEAAGAYVQADPLLDTLHVLPRYPALPWDWSAATPDMILPSAPVVREAVEWLDKARYNRVFVSGTEAGGILGQVTRNGTAGDLVAPMVTDSLCTHADAARARGGAILADTGRQARITLDLPVLTETGIIRPGALVEYTDAGTARRGLVRSTAVRAQLPTARQTIELEAHV